MSFKTEMKVVRFGSEDVIATSGALTKSFTLSGFGDGALGATAVYNATNYNLQTKDDVTSFISALGVTSPGISAGSTPQSLRSTINVEVTRGANSYWNGSYNYDPTATWTNSNGQTCYGVFNKQ